MLRTILVGLLIPFLAAAVLAGEGRDRPRVLVTGFDAFGVLLDTEPTIARSLETITEAVLAESFQTVSGTDFELVRDVVGAPLSDLHRSADHRLELAKHLGAKWCVTGWACSIGNRVVLVVEAIHVGSGLPGRVRRATCHGLDAIPDALESLLAVEGLWVAGAGDPQNGIRSLAAIFASIPEDDLLDTYPNEAYRKLIAMRDNDTRSRDPVDVARAEGLLGDAMTHMRRLAIDRNYRDEWAIRTRVRFLPVLNEYEFEVGEALPYLVFVEKGDDGAPILNARGLGKFLHVFQARFHHLFGVSAGVSDIETRERPDERFLVVIVLRPRPGFTHSPPPPPVRGGYTPSNRIVYLFVDPDRAKPDEIVRHLVRGATPQLLHLYRKIGVGEASGGTVSWSDPRLTSRSPWLEKGLAEFMAGALTPVRWTFDPSRASATCRTHWASLRGEKKDDWTLENLLSITSTESLGKRWLAGDRPTLEIEALRENYRAQAWAWIYFLWHAEKGKYRDRLLAGLKNEIRGRTGYAGWRDLWFEKGARVDWSEVEAEWRAWESAQSK